jgi:hypothetical protein
MKANIIKGLSIEPKKYFASSALLCKLKENEEEEG